MLKQAFLRVILWLSCENASHPTVVSGSFTASPFGVPRLSPRRPLMRPRPRPLRAEFEPSQPTLSCNRPPPSRIRQPDRPSPRTLPALFKEGLQGPGRRGPSRSVQVPSRKRNTACPHAGDDGRSKVKTSCRHIVRDRVLASAYPASLESRTPTRSTS